MSDTDTDTKLINPKRLIRIEEKMSRLSTMRPLPADVLRKLNEEMMLLHTYHSNAIEGNTLTQKETKLILEKGLTIGGKSLREHLEATNNAKAFALMEQCAGQIVEIDHGTIQLIHEVVTKGIIDSSGQYRRKNVRISGAIQTPPDWSKIIALTDQLIADVKNSTMHPIETAAFLHHRLVEIHPFVDGNGRVARLLTNLYLIRNHYPVIILKKEGRKMYYSSLKAADSGNLSPFANILAKAVDESLSIYLSVSGGDDELLPLRIISETTPYSQEYLSLRARQGILDAVKIGKTWHTSRRAVRDYIDSHGKKDN